MSAKFTKGPWTAEEDSEGTTFEIRPPKRARVIATIDAYAVDSPEEAEANAALICAAPDLYDAVKKAERVFSGWDSIEDSPEEHQAIAEMRAAIARVEIR